MRIIVLLALIVSMLACKGEWEESNNQTATPVRQTDADGSSEGYTLRIIFSGLIAFVPMQETPNPKQMWVLIGNATDPVHLPIGSSVIHSHRNRIYIPEENIIEPLPGTMTSGDKPCLAGSEVINWRFMTFEDEDIVLNSEGKIVPDKLQIDRGEPRMPVTPGTNHARLFDWASEVETLLANAVSDLEARKISGAFLKSTGYNCNCQYPLISARLLLEKGAVFTERFWPKSGNPNSVGTFFFPNAAAHTPRALARAIAVEMELSEPIKFQRRSLSRTPGVEFTDIIVDGKQGEIVTIFIENETDHCRAMQPPSKDFLFNYNLLKGPITIDEDHLPKPKEQAPPSDKGMCSPLRSSAPTVSP